MSTASAYSLEPSEWHSSPTKGKSAGLRLRARLGNPKYVKATKSGKAECIVKVASHVRGFRVKALMEYVARTEEGKEPVEFETENGTYNLGQADVQSTYDEWSKDFDRKKPGTQRVPRHATHVILSGNIENNARNRRKLLVAGKNVSQKHFGDRGYKFVLALHEEGGKAHVHVVVANKHRGKGPKLRLNPPELLELRTDLAKEMSSLGLEHVATLRKDRPNVIDLVQKGIERIEKKENMFQRRLRSASPSVDAFQHKKNVARNIVHLRQTVKKQTFVLSGKRQKLLDDLRGLEVKLMAPAFNIRVEKEITATLNHFQKEIQGFRGYVQEFKNPEHTPDLEGKPFKGPLSKVGEKIEKVRSHQTRKKTLAKMGEQLEARIQDARIEIKSSNAPDLEKKASLEQLKQYEFEVKNSFHQPNQKVDVKGENLENHLLRTVDRLEKRDQSFHQEYRFGRHGRPYNEHSKAFERSVDLLEKRVDEQTTTFGKTRAECLERLADLKAKHNVRETLYKGVVDLRQRDEEFRKQLLDGTNWDSLQEYRKDFSTAIAEMKTASEENTFLPPKEKKGFATSFQKMEQIQGVREQVLNLRKQDEEYFQRLETGQKVEWSKQDHSAHMGKAIDQTNKVIKETKLPYSERKALFKEVGKVRLKVAQDHIKTTGADRKISKALDKIKNVDKFHWSTLKLKPSLQQDSYLESRKKAFAKLRETVKEAKFPQEQRKAVYKEIRKQEFKCENRQTQALTTVVVERKVERIAAKDKAFYSSLSRVGENEQANRIKEYRVKLKAEMAKLRKGIYKARFDTDQQKKLYGRVKGADLGSQKMQKQFEVGQQVEKKLSDLQKKNVEFKKIGKGTKADFAKHTKSIQKDLKEIRASIKAANFSKEQRIAHFTAVRKAESQLPKKRKVMTPESIVKDMQAKEKEFRLQLKKAGKNPAKRKAVQKKMEKAMSVSVSQINRTKAPEAIKLRAKRQVQNMQKGFSLGAGFGL